MGLQFDDAKGEFLDRVLRRRLTQVGQSSTTYLHRLSTAPGPEECSALARELTVGETYFFRNRDQFHALADIALPERMQANAATRRLHLLSAGCASGEEAYSLVIAARECIPDASWETVVSALDINPTALEKARRAHYSSWSLRETPAPIGSKYFRSVGRELVLDQTVREAVRFEEHNLALDNPELWRAGSLDIIFCRNVIMYFAPDQARALIARLAQALRPGGYLFLGSAESLRGLSDAFELQHTHDTFYFRRKDGTDRPMPPPVRDRGSASTPIQPGESSDDQWVGAIREASERIVALTRKSAVTPPQPMVPALDGLAEIFDLLCQERFAAALVQLRSLVPPEPQQPDALLLEGILLTHNGLLAEAEEVCRRLLLIDDRHAGAYHVLALCRESAGDMADAAEHNEIAIRLDPTFAMPRLHLGLIAQRIGDRSGGRRDLARALVLLQTEDEIRLTLFGGGFKREALLALCESALRDCGGTP
jgi:chemotaxis protein methyltransferase CheR